MERVRINAYYKGLVFKNNQFVKMLHEGSHWLWAGYKVSIYDMSKPLILNSPDQLTILLQHKEIEEALLIIDVPDNQIAISYENGLFKAVHPAGRYAFWKGLVEYKFITADISNTEITQIENRELLANPALSLYIRQYNIEPYEKALLYKDGSFDKELAPGNYFFWKNSIPLMVYRIDTRQQQLELNGQEILTKDKANLRINFAALYKVTDIYKAVENKEYEKQLYTLLQLALRELIATYTLDELLDKREAINPVILKNVASDAAKLGIELISCGIRDIILPGDMKEIINQVLIAEKKAQANIITRREETASTRSLLNTAKLMEENAMLLKLKEMEYVEKIADKINSISLSGGGDLVNQLKDIFIPGSKEK